MNIKNFVVRDYLRSSSVFVYENDTILTAIKAMNKFKISQIAIIKEDFSISGYLNKQQIKEILKTGLNNDFDLLRNTKIKNVMGKHDFPIVLYPGMKIVEAYMTMKYLEKNYLPVVAFPWEKRIIGFLHLDDISSIINESYLKISV